MGSVSLKYDRPPSSSGVTLAKFLKPQLNAWKQVAEKITNSCLELSVELSKFHQIEK